MKPKTLVLRAAGTNCDGETAHAFELAGATVERVHLNAVLEKPAMLDEYQLLAFPGGFSYGDDIAAGKILARQITAKLGDALRRFVGMGKPVIGICNGFQVLVKTDLLPGPLAGESGQTATLAHNDSGRFICRWTRVRPVGNKCVWTQGLGEIELPIAHGEGKLVPASAAVQSALHEKGQVALEYVGENPNGSADAIAGICDSTGLVFGLMPHPERHVSPLQHPAWASRRNNGDGLDGDGQGLAIFRNAVKRFG